VLEARPSTSPGLTSLLRSQFIIHQRGLPSGTGHTWHLHQQGFKRLGSP
jgi:hypothetical protein